MYWTIFTITVFSGGLAGEWVSVLTACDWQVHGEDDRSTQLRLCAALRRLQQLHSASLHSACITIIHQQHHITKQCATANFHHPRLGNNITDFHITRNLEPTPADQPPCHAMLDFDPSPTKWVISGLRNTYENVVVYILHNNLAFILFFFAVRRLDLHNIT